MAMVGENQVRNLYVVETSTNTTVSTIKAGSALNGAIVKSDGSAVADNEPFVLSVLGSNNQLVRSDVIVPANVTYVKSVANQARVLGSTTISSITAEANKLYNVRIVFKNHGSLSVENEYIKEAFYKSTATDDAENIVDGLVKSLARNFSREQPDLGGQTFSYTMADLSTVNLPDNAFFTFSKTGTGATAALVITEKAAWLSQYYVTGKKTRLSFPFEVLANFPTDPTTATTASFEGVASGYHVRNMEEYYKGNRADTFRGAGYPHNFEESYDSVLGSDYNLIEIGYFDEGRDDPMKSKKSLTIAVLDDGATNVAANALITQLNTALTSQGKSADAI